MILRPAILDDVEAVLKFWLDAAENDDRPADTAEAVRTLIERDPAALCLAVDEDGIVGTLIAGWDGWRCHLYRLAVRPGRRRQGIAGTLLAAAEQRFREFGAGRVDAMVLDDNDLGQNLWTRSGYQRQDNWSRWVKPLA
ncbi:GNAT family N-acetyltransferase [Actinocrispum sp. NPDC049592]|uniref:GNAT family N-acetyltransferase n=1 Tax=Actinocrispum sp. NPDC049592 TaxID=3154835 RepID=UPI0034418165